MDSVYYFSLLDEYDINFAEAKAAVAELQFKTLGTEKQLRFWENEELRYLLLVKEGKDETNKLVLSGRIRKNVAMEHLKNRIALMLAKSELSRMY